MPRIRLFKHSLLLLALLLFPRSVLLADGKLVAKFGEINGSTYKCVKRPDGTTEVVFSKGNRTETELDAAQSKRKLKRESNKINRKKRNIKNKIKNKKKRKKKIQALNEKKENIKETQNSAAKCFTGELPVKRSDPSGLYTIQFPLTALPPGADLGGVSLEQTTLDGLQVLPEPQGIFQIMPGGITLMSPGGTFTFPLGSGTSGNDTSEPMVMPFTLSDNAENANTGDDFSKSIDAEVVDSNSKTSLSGEELKKERAKAQFSFSEFTRVVFGQLDYSGEGSDNFGIFKWNAPECVFFQEEFNIKITIQRKVNATAMKGFNHNGDVVKHLVGANGSYAVKGTLTVSNHVSPPRKIELGPRSTLGDAVEFPLTFTCIRTGTIVFKFSGSEKGMLIDLVNGNHEETGSYNFSRTLELKCKKPPKACKKISHRMTAPTEGESKQEFIGVQIDANKKLSSKFEISNPKSSDGSLVPGATSVTSKLIQPEDLPDHLQSVFKPDPGKQILIVQVDVDGGDGSKHDLEVTAFCE